MTTCQGLTAICACLKMDVIERFSRLHTTYRLDSPRSTSTCMIAGGAQVFPNIEIHSGFLKSFQSVTENAASPAFNITAVLQRLAGDRLHCALPSKLLACTPLQPACPGLPEVRCAWSKKICKPGTWVGSRLSNVHSPQQR